LIGQTISHYKVLDKLGEGGMSAVYRAKDTRLERSVELKFLPNRLLGEAEIQPDPNRRNLLARSNETRFEHEGTSPVEEALLGVASP